MDGDAFGFIAVCSLPGLVLGILLTLCFQRACSCGGGKISQFMDTPAVAVQDVVAEKNVKICSGHVPGADQKWVYLAATGDIVHLNPR